MEEFLHFRLMLHSALIAVCRTHVRRELPTGFKPISAYAAFEILGIGRPRMSLSYMLGKFVPVVKDLSAYAAFEFCQLNTL